MNRRQEHAMAFGAGRLNVDQCSLCRELLQAFSSIYVMKLRTVRNEEQGWL